ncbi:MAG: DNA repair protein RecN [Nitrospira sp.]|nr:DNA repair protein RecN [Candidatus Manganitrophaceae bacterium]HIL34565.1 DNA repair protein RecN [Candidatus Manganitrophaceae bacterium]
MLRELRIKDYAIIDEVSLCFDGGLNVITGETGTGKSILVEALALILGGRFTSEAIRQGVNEATLEARFDPPPHSSPTDDPVDYFILKRVLSRSGKNRVYLNGSLSNLSSLKQIGQKSVEIHGQQENHNLADTNHHLFLLDCFCQILEERSRYKSSYRDWVFLRQERTALEERALEGKRQASFIEHQLLEIRGAKLDPDEEKSLEREERLLKNGSGIVSLSEQAYARLSEEGGVFNLLDEVERAVQGLHDATEDASSEMELVETSKIQLKELAISLRDRLEHVEHHPERLQEVRERLYLIQRMKKKYGLSSIEEILAYQEGLDEDLNRLLTVEERLRDVDAQLNEMEDNLSVQAAFLSRRRAKVKEALEKKVQQELGLLGMEKTLFNVSLKEIPLSETGNERVEFLIAQPGEIPQGITKIASGGELSRIMLALKVVLAEVDPVPTLVFDEIDAGIGGAVAERVGRRLSRLSEGHQVFCITHLAQIACMADHHYFVEKGSQGERVATSVKELSKEERVTELARMLGGVTITPITLRHAAEMIDLKSGSGRE